MPAAGYERLLSPLALGHVTLRNRIAMMPHAVMFGAGYGSAIERTIAYHVEQQSPLLIARTVAMSPGTHGRTTWEDRDPTVTHLAACCRSGAAASRPSQM